MATSITANPGRHSSLAPDAFERALAIGAAVLLVFVLVALAKGAPAWARIPANVWAHLACMIGALALTPIMLLRRRGDAQHRLLGRLWVGAMILTALISLTIRNANHGGFSFIHLLSVLVLVQVPVLWWSARRHDVGRHRNGVRAMVLGALLIAGFFTFPFNRMLGQFLFS